MAVQGGLNEPRSDNVDRNVVRLPFCSYAAAEHDDGGLACRIGDDLTGSERRCDGADFDNAPVQLPPHDPNCDLAGIPRPVEIHVEDVVKIVIAEVERGHPPRCPAEFTRVSIVAISFSMVSIARCTSTRCAPSAHS